MIIPGYILADDYCRPNLIHGVSMIYIKAGVLRVSAFSDEMECDVSGVILMDGSVKLGILSIYRPCSGDFETFLETLSY